MDKAINMFLHDARVAFYLLPVVSMKCKLEDDPVQGRKRALPKKSSAHPSAPATPRMPAAL
eukprot:955553-Amphidinium_carterae.1